MKELWERTWNLMDVAQKLSGWSGAFCSDVSHTGFSSRMSWRPHVRYSERLGEATGRGLLEAAGILVHGCFLELLEAWWKLHLYSFGYAFRAPGVS